MKKIAKLEAARIDKIVSNLGYCSRRDARVLFLLD